MQVGYVVGDVDGAIDAVDIDTVLEPGGNQRAMMDEPLTLYFQLTILPSDKVAAMVSR